MKAFIKLGLLISTILGIKVEDIDNLSQKTPIEINE